jgi:hypothetical protein
MPYIISIFLTSGKIGSGETPYHFLINVAYNPTIMPQEISKIWTVRTTISKGKWMGKHPKVIRP